MDADLPALRPQLRPLASPPAQKHVPDLFHVHNPLHSRLLAGFLDTAGRLLRKLNFIKLHYIYIVLLSIIGSIALYPNQNIRYIDALFFAMSSCTQGGLNPIDVNLLNSWQQAVLYILPILTTPVFINTFVVFVRLHYFEKEFSGIRKRSKLESKYRRTLTRSRTLARGDEPKQSVLQRALAPFSASFASSATALDTSSANPLPLAADPLNRDTMRNTLSNMNANTRFPATVDLENGDRLHPRRTDSQDNSQQQLDEKHAAPPPLASRAITFNDPFRPPKASPAGDSPRRASALATSRPGSRRASASPDNTRSDAGPRPPRDIRFGDLPHPPHGDNDTSRNNKNNANINKRQKAVLPSDIVHSISMMENRNRTAHGDDDDEGPALVIRRPQDIEEEEEQKARAHHHHRRHKERTHQTRHKREDMYPRHGEQHESKTPPEDHSEDTTVVEPAAVPLSRLDVSSQAPRPRRSISFGLPQSNLTSTTCVAESTPASAADEYAVEEDEGSDSGMAPIARSLTHTPHRDGGVPMRTRATSLDGRECAKKQQQQKHSFDFPHRLAHLKKFSFSGRNNPSSPLSPASNFDNGTTMNNEPDSEGSDGEDGEGVLGKSGGATSTSSDTNGSTVPPHFFFSAPTRTMTMDSDSDAPSLNLRRAMSSNYLSWQPTVEGNSVFVDLTEDQKEELGGVEYRALKLLAKILVGYYVGWNVAALTIFTPWGVHAEAHREMFREIAVERGWWGIFTASSAFNNVGLTLTPNSMSSFSSSLYVLIFTPFFMIIGNTGFPVFLRFTIWIMFKLTDPYGRMHESLGFLLDHPRRCFTLLFPSGPTWWLLGIVLALNLIDMVLFLILDLNNIAVTVIPVGYRILSGFFQAVATRTTGFGILDIGKLHPAILVSYTIMMYINIFPVAMSVRHTNVYEEQTLGLYRAPTAVPGLRVNGSRAATIATLGGAAPPETASAKKISDVSTHLMRQLSYDLWFLFIALFIVCISEEGKINSPTNSIPIFNILFELTSAYGTVGLSTGYPGVNTSLSGQFSTIGKLVVIALLYRGRHRSLPYAIDRAIILPSKKMQENDLAQEMMVGRRPSLFPAPTMLTRTASTLSARGAHSGSHTPRPHAARRAAAPSIYSSGSSSASLSSGRSRDNDDDDDDEDEAYDYEYDRQGGHAGHNGHSGHGGTYLTSNYPDELTRTFTTGSRRVLERNGGLSLRTPR